MMTAIEALRAIVDPSRIVEAPVVLSEEAQGNRCDPIQVRYCGESWALRLRDGDHLRVLAELPTERSVRRLPDYLVFSAPRAAARLEDELLQILVCELKSGAAGAEAALPQVQLGRLFAEYLVRVAAHGIGQPAPLKTWCCGLIASPQMPASLITKGRTRPGKVEPPNHFDKLSGMRIYHVPGGGEIRLESLY